MHSRMNFSELIEYACLFYLIAWAISPIFQYGIGFRLIFMVCFFLLVLIKLSQGYRLTTSQSSIALFIVFLLFMTLVIDGVSSVNQRFQAIICLLFFMLYYFYQKDNKKLMIIFWLVTSLCIIWNLRTLQAYTTIHNISRMLAKDFDGAEYYAKQGIGGYGYIYSMVFMLFCALKVFNGKLNKHVLVKRIVLIVYILTTLLLLLSAGYFLALLLTIFGLISLVITNIKSVNIRVLSYAGCVIVALLIIINFDTIMSFVADISKGTMYQSKVQDIITSISEDQVVGTVYGRYERYQRSIRLFFESPLWGQLTRKDVGKHSQILDFFAQYGIFVGVWFCSIFTGFKNQIKKKNYINKDFIEIVVLFFMIFACVNNLSYTNGVIIAFCLPGAICIRNNSNTEGSNDL